MKRVTFAVVSFAAFSAALAITLPISFALSWLGADRMGVSAAEVSGSIWDGRLRAGQYRGVPLGDIEASLDPFALLAGTRRLAVQGTLGRATLVQGDTRGFEMADAAIEVEHLRPSLPLAGRLRLENATLLFSGERCTRAEGRIATDVLQRAFNGPEVAGTLACAGEAAIAQLEGRMQDVQVSIALRLDARGRYQAETRIVSANPMVRGVLALAGFAENGDGFTRSDEGNLGT
jgi:hypothetical protein